MRRWLAHAMMICWRKLMNSREKTPVLIPIGDVELRLDMIARALGIPAATLEKLASGEWVAVPKPDDWDIGTVRPPFGVMLLLYKSDEKLTFAGDALNDAIYPLHRSPRHD